MDRNCPLCGSNKCVDYSYKTYKTCTNCHHTYQPNPPLKSVSDRSIKLMGDREKTINEKLASFLHTKYHPKTMLDIGCAYPYFPHCFKKFGVQSIAIDKCYKSNDLNMAIQEIDWEDLEDGGYDSWKGTDFISMVHVLEYFLDPISCLKRAYDNLSDDGVLFIRSPNKNVQGIEREHTEDHILIHPSIFGSESIKYAATKVGFHLIWEKHTANAGRSSWIFKKKPASISLFMIVKNEEKNITECLNTIKNQVDEMILLDTGSTDKTIELAEQAGAIVFKSEFYNAKTEQSEFNFAHARNEAMQHANGDWLFWMDADDRFNGNLSIAPPLDAYHVGIEYGDTKYAQNRVFRNKWGIRFKGAIHELPILNGVRVGDMPGCTITHLCGKKPGRIKRNLAILQAETKNHPEDKRTMFYLANAFRENQEYDKAIIVYQKYIGCGGAWKDELSVAKYYLALCYYNQSKWDLALQAIHLAMAHDDRWGEPYALAGECYFYKKQFQKAIHYFHIVLDMPFPKTKMFVERNRYRREPRLWLSHCHEQLGEKELSLKWAEGFPKRIEKLKSKKLTIEVCRLGALGDVLCTTAAVREIRKKNPEAHIRYVTHSHSAQILRHNPDINEIITDNIERSADLRFNFVYPVKEGYPFKPLTRHIAECFADSVGIILPNNWKAILNITPEDMVKFGHKKPIITFAVKTGWSKYKDWPFERWSELIKLFPEYQWIQLGANGEMPIDGAQHMMGKLTLRESFSAMHQSMLFVGLDSVFNHATIAMGVPAVILFGSTSPIGSGYPENTNLWSKISCTPCYKESNEISAHPMLSCPYEHKCMVDFMSIERVAEAVKQKLS